VATVNLEHALGIGFLRPPAGDAVGDFLLFLVQGRLLAALFIQGMPFDHERLSHAGKVEVAVQFGCRPDLPELDAPVIRGIIRDKVGFTSVLEEELDILMERWLILLDGEVVVGLAPDEVVGYRALGKKGIGSDVLALDVDGVKERDGCFDLIGPFGFFIVCDRQPVYFFWV